MFFLYLKQGESRKKPLKLYKKPPSPTTTKSKQTQANSRSSAKANFECIAEKGGEEEVNFGALLLLAFV
jgi:hypothetical protein